jgi:hypothetical protein
MLNLQHSTFLERVIAIQKNLATSQKMPRILENLEGDAMAAQKTLQKLDAHWNAP